MGKKKLTIPRNLVAAIAYLALVGVVIYGTTDHAYDGFGPAVPWIICGVFIVMAAVRFYEYVLSLRAQRAVDRYNDTKKQGEEENGEEHE